MSTCQTKAWQVIYSERIPSSFLGKTDCRLCLELLKDWQIYMNCWKCRFHLLENFYIVMLSPLSAFRTFTDVDNLKFLYYYMLWNQVDPAVCWSIVRFFLVLYFSDNQKGLWTGGDKENGNGFEYSDSEVVMSNRQLPGTGVHLQEWNCF